MSVTISGDDGVSKVQDGVIVQADLAAGVAGTGPAFSASDTATTATAGTATLVVFDTEDFDTDGAWNGSKFQPLAAGYYQINASVSNGVATNTGSVVVFIRKNGNAINSAITPYGANASARASTSTLVYLNGSTDYIEIYGTNINNANLSTAFVSGFLARAA